MTETSQDKERAVRRLVEGFDNIPLKWAALAAEHLDEEPCYAFPMWGTLFRVSNMDRGNIEKLLVPAIPKDAVGLIEFAEEHGIEIEEAEMKLLALAAADEDEIDEDEIEAIATEVYEAWTESGDEDAALVMAGWDDVGSTGIVAREFDGELLLGINGAGYDFYESHWHRLYEELGYSWHK